MTLGEVVLGAFDLATEYARRRTRAALDKHGTIEDPRVTRDDFVQAVIALRFDLMAIELAQLDMMREQHGRAMMDLQERLARARVAGDVPNVTVVQPCPEWPRGCVGYEGHPGPHGSMAPRMPED